MAEQNNGDKTLCAARACPCAGRQPNDPARRKLLGLAAKLGLLGLGLPLTATAAGRKPERMPPQAGDLLVHAYGPRTGQVLRSDEVVTRAAPIAAWPKDSGSGVVRDRSRLNLVLVLRLDEGALSEQTAQHAVDGLVAYSAVCTHTGCTVEGWDNERLTLICPCHGSEYIATQGASVALGPAPKPLAMLPLGLADTTIVVKHPFTRKVGFQQKF